MAITVAAATFIRGWLSRWRRLREAMAACYAVMAALCAVQTFGVLEHASRFVEMAIEYAEYLVILTYLHLSPTVLRCIGPAVPGLAGA